MMLTTVLEVGGIILSCRQGKWESPSVNSCHYQCTYRFKWSSAGKPKLQLATVEQTFESCQPRWSSKEIKWLGQRNISLEGPLRILEIWLQTLHCLRRVHAPYIWEQIRDIGPVFYFSFTAFFHKLREPVSYSRMYSNCVPGVSLSSDMLASCHEVGPPWDTPQLTGQRLLKPLVFCCNNALVDIQTQDAPSSLNLPPPKVKQEETWGQTLSPWD